MDGLSQNSYPATGSATLSSGSDQVLIFKDNRAGVNWNYMEWQFQDGTRDWVMGRRHSDGYFTLWRNGAGDVLTIDNAGKIGIGTSNALYKLTLAGGDIKAYNYDNNSGISIGAEGWERPRVGFHVSDNNRRFKIEFNDGNLPSERLGFFTNNGGAWAETEVFSIGKTGNVGIGTNSPDARLTVKGDVHTREVRVDMAGSVAGDYVFEKDYNLLPLSELEFYINENKHLPEVPSAKEMEENGLNLKEMNLILLRKIEELTLHVIELNKEIALLKQNNASPDLSGKKVEELTLYRIEQQKHIAEQD